MRSVAAPSDQPRYEIFHDVLALAILDWRARYIKAQEQAESERQLVRERQRVTRLRLGVIGLFLLLIVMVGLAFYAFQQRNAATQERNWAEEQARIAKEAARAAEKARTEAVIAQKRAEEQRLEALKSKSRGLAAASINNLDIDPERSVLLALQAVSITYSIDKKPLHLNPKRH